MDVHRHQTTNNFTFIKILLVPSGEFKEWGGPPLGTSGLTTLDEADPSDFGIPISGSEAKDGVERVGCDASGNEGEGGDDGNDGEVLVADVHLADVGPREGITGKVEPLTLSHSLHPARSQLSHFRRRRGLELGLHLPRHLLPRDQRRCPQPSVGAKEPGSTDGGVEGVGVSWEGDLLKGFWRRTAA